MNLSELLALRQVIEGIPQSPDISNMKKRDAVRWIDGRIEEMLEDIGRGERDE